MDDRFELRINEELLKKADKDKDAYGLNSISGFIRLLIAQHPAGERKWSDVDMMEFAKTWAAREKPPHILEDPAKQMQNALDKFKKDFLTTK